jgi:hypothetical protein
MACETWNRLLFLFGLMHRLGSSLSLKGLKIAIAHERSKKVRKYERNVRRDGLGYPARAPNFTVGFFLRRRGLAVENNNKFPCQFLQVTFEMLRMSQVRISLLFSWDGLEPSLPNAPYFIILLCLTPDDFTCAWESAGAQWVKPQCAPMPLSNHRQFYPLILP